VQPHEIIERVLFKNDDIIVLNKPAGLPVHYGKGGGVNLEQFFGLLRFELPNNPLLAHRLDKDTSGCLVLGRHKDALAKLGKMFENRRVTKTYIAKIDGELEGQGIINAPLGKKLNDPRNWHMQVRPDGQEAITEYKMIGKNLVELMPKTGRTHQLRVHMAHLGTPIIGDKIYGSGTDGSRLMLHAASITLPFHDNIITVTAPLPSEFLI
jgi:tRNA pseudouridine32 synthase/23S rRNA pseudouridine746 synthase